MSAYAMLPGDKRFPGALVAARENPVFQKASPLIYMDGNKSKDYLRKRIAYLRKCVVNLRGASREDGFLTFHIRAYPRKSAANSASRDSAP